MIAVMLVDDHRLVRAGLQSLIDATDDLSVVGTASDGAEAVVLAEMLRPDVVLMDLSMPGIDGIEATRRLLAVHPAAQVLVLTSFSDRAKVVAALDAGAVGYLLKDAEPPELLRGIRAVVRGESPLDPRAARVLLESRAGAPGVTALTAREREVLAMLVQGMANKQIARAMGITESTVKAHLTSIFGRIGVPDRTSAAVWALDHLGEA